MPSGNGGVAPWPWAILQVVPLSEDEGGLKVRKVQEEAAQRYLRSSERRAGEKVRARFILAQATALARGNADRTEFALFACG